MHALSRAGLVMLLMAGLGAPATGCRRGPPLDASAEQARLEERQGRVLVRRDTDQAVCDASLNFARARLLYSRSNVPRLTIRGDRLMGTWAPVCESRIVRFWQAFTGCDTPLQGRERDTFIYWDPARAAAFQAYGLPGIAQAMTNGRARWQQACAADHGAVAVREPELRAQLPLPVPVLAVQPVGVVVPGQTPQLGEGFRLMVEGNFDGALGVLTQIWENEPTPLVTFSIGVCHDRLGARQEALVHYQEVTSDPTLGPPAQARMTLLTADGGTPSASARRRAQQNFVQAGEHFQGGNHGAAIEAFQRSYAAVPHARTLFNIAFCYQSMGQILPALAYYFIVAHDDSVDEETRNQSIVALRQLAQEHLREMGQ